MQFFERQHEARVQTVRLLLLFALTVIALVLAVNGALALTWRVVSAGSADYPYGFFVVNTGVTLLLVLGGWWIESSSLQGGGEKLARRVGAREARPATSHAEQRLCNIVDELAIAASMPAPRPMVLPRHTGINAFAAGWHARDAVVAVTQGALDHLTRDELQGLLAHEFSHLREGDTRLNMRLAGMVSGLEMVFRLGSTLCEADAHGRRSLLLVPGVAIVATGSLGWLAGRALKAAVSRQREFLADARAVQFTRSRDGLGGVLRKVAGLVEAGEATPALHPSVQHMALVAGDNAHDGDALRFASHPPLAERIRRIYGRPMGALRLSGASTRDAEPTRPAALF